MSAQHTPGPWPLSSTGDGKRYIIGDGLVEGPNGYEVAEVYSDDCDWEVAAANARLIAAAPDLLAFVVRVAKRDPVFAKGTEKQEIAEARQLVAKARGQ